MSDFVIAQAVADTSRDGVILYHAEGQALYRNTVATALLRGAAEGHAAEAAIKEVALTATRLGDICRLELNGFEISATPISSAFGPIAIVTIRADSSGENEVDLRARFGFSPRESQVAALLAQRRTDGEIAAALGISWHTVRSHVERVFRILGARNRRDAAEKLNEQDGR